MEAPDLRERGASRGGEPQTSERRLFMQLVAFGGVESTEDLTDQLEDEDVPATLYADANDPRGVALLTWSDDPGFFACRVRAMLNRDAFAELTVKPEYSMMGRTYALGHEPQLEDWLLDTPRRRVTDPEWPWAVWYPLRRKGEFSALPPEEQRAILSEHGRIGHSFGEAGLALDVRLACFGMDRNDNDFVIGLIGKELHPLSACVQAMRRTRQTSTYMEKMGPFFVGRAIWQRIGT
jgi:chlorite dismutase